MAGQGQTKPSAVIRGESGMEVREVVGGRVGGGGSRRGDVGVGEELGGGAMGGRKGSLHPGTIGTCLCNAQ